MVISTRISQQSIQQKMETPGRHGRLGANSAGDEKAVMPLTAAQALLDNHKDHEQHVPLSAQMLASIQKLMQEFDINAKDVPKESFATKPMAYFSIESNNSVNGYSKYQSQETDDEAIATFQIDI